MPKSINIPQPDPEAVENFREHEHGFCHDASCPCKESQTLIGELNDHVQNGLASTDDANRIYKGKVV